MIIPGIIASRRRDVGPVEIDPITLADWAFVGSGLVDSSGTATQWNPAVGTHTLKRVAGVAYQANWRNGHAAMLRTTGYMYDGFPFPTWPAVFQKSGTPAAYSTVLVGQFPLGPSGAYAGFSANGGPSLLTLFDEGASVVSFGSPSNGVMGAGRQTFIANMASYLGLPFIAVARASDSNASSASDCRLFLKVLGFPLIETPLISGAAGALNGFDLAIGSFFDSNGGWVAPISAVYQIQRGLTNAEMEGIANWGTSEFLL